MKLNRASLLVAALIAALALVGCVTVQPKPLQFDLIHDKTVFTGYFHPQDRRMEADLGDKHFEGFYLQASSTAFSQGMWLRRGLPNETFTTISSNTAKAVMNSPDGEQLFCDFMFEGFRALGECKTGSGLSYHLVSPHQ